MRTLSKLHYTTYEVWTDDDGNLLRGVIAKEITSRKFVLLSYNKDKQSHKTVQIGVYEQSEKVLTLNTRTPYCYYDKLTKRFLISVGMLIGLPATKRIDIRHNGKTYSTTTRYFFYRGTSELSPLNSSLYIPLSHRHDMKHHFHAMTKGNFGMSTAQVWENYVDTRHLEELSVFDLYSLNISFSQYTWALENSEAYRKRFLNNLVDSASNNGGQDNG